MTDYRGKHAESNQVICIYKRASDQQLMTSQTEAMFGFSRPQLFF